MLAIFYQFIQFWDIKNFFSQALHIDESELDSITWREVQKRLITAQKDHLMCIHKEQLTDLDIYHRILRFKNYLVSMVNKEILPVRVTLLPCMPSMTFFSHGLKFNLQWLFFKVIRAFQTLKSTWRFTKYTLFRDPGPPLTSGT